MHPAQKAASNEIPLDPQVQQQEEWQHAGDFSEPSMQAENPLDNSDLPEWQRTTIAAQQAMEAREEHQRRFMEAQQNPDRVEYDDGFNQLSHMGPSSSALGKRPARFDDDGLDPSQDAGFQTDDRNVDVAARRRQAPVGQSRSLMGPPPDIPRKRARFAGHNGDNADMQLDGAAEENLSQLSATSSSYQDIKEIAKQNRKAASVPTEQGGGLLALPTAATPSGRRSISGGPSKRQWSQDEEEALVEYIGTLGCSWAEIKRADDGKAGGPLLGQWSQVDLKDKAIGIKAHYLQSRNALPQNFEGVSLRKRDKDRLRNMGINPDAI